MDGTDALTIEVIGGLDNVSREEWDALANPPGAPFDPFLCWDFLQALEESGCASASSGWQPAHLIARDAAGAAVGAMPLYAKDHSYGEYVFDHAWADALYRAGGAYYPKLQCAVPFTPVPGRRLFAQSPAVEAALAQGAIGLAQRIGASSVHATFSEPEMCERVAPLGYLTRAGLQYHWFNRGYATFDDFLADLSANRRKNVRKERARACEQLRIRTRRGADIKPHHWDFFFACYQDTGARKWGSPYLNRDFFQVLGERMADRCVLFVAEEQDGGQLASALNVLGSEALYGRYWGRMADAPFLHFELCYYRAIDLAIELGLKRVEAGAQGEHKMARGLLPVRTHIAEGAVPPNLSDAVARYLAADTQAVAEEADILAAHAPFRQGG